MNQYPAAVSDLPAPHESVMSARNLGGQWVTDCNGCDLMAWSKEKQTYFCGKTDQRLVFVCTDNAQTGFREYQEYIGSQCPLPEWDYGADPLHYWVENGFEIAALKKSAAAK